MRTYILLNDSYDTVRFLSLGGVLTLTRELLEAGREERRVVKSSQVHEREVV